MKRLIPSLMDHQPKHRLISAVFFACVSCMALVAPVQSYADDNKDILPSSISNDAPRPNNTGEFYKRCRDEALYCDEQFAAYIQRYAAVRVEEMAQRPEYRLLRQNLRDPNAFDGICLPRASLFSDDFMKEIQRSFRSWAEKNPDRHKERVPVGIKAALQELYPCTQ